MAKRIRALDGFRGLAVGLILLHHLFQVGGTWVGVDIFFVLSGFLITSILRAERDDVHFWRVFYIRRMTRILPAYIMLIAAVILLTRLNWRLIWPYYTFFGANVANVRFGDPVIGPLSILWSLAVEEHFYFVWPAMVRFFPGRRTLLWILSSVIVAEPVLRTIGLRLSGDWWTCYFLTPFRLDGLALGALLSLLLSDPKLSLHCNRWAGRSLLAAIAGCVLVFAVYRISRHHTPWIFNAIGTRQWRLPPQRPLPGSSCAPRASPPGSCPSARSASSAKSATASTSITGSFGIVRELFPHLGVASNGLIALAVSLLVAWLSFELVEKRFLALGKRLVGTYRTLPGPVETTA